MGHSGKGSLSDYQGIRVIDRQGCAPVHVRAPALVINKRSVAPKRPRSASTSSRGGRDIRRYLDEATTDEQEDEEMPDAEEDNTEDDGEVAAPQPQPSQIGIWQRMVEWAAAN